MFNLTQYGRNFVRLISNHGFYMTVILFLEFCCKAALHRGHASFAVRFLSLAIVVSWKLLVPVTSDTRQITTTTWNTQYVHYLFYNTHYECTVPPGGSVVVTLNVGIVTIVHKGLFTDRIICCWIQNRICREHNSDAWAKSRTSWWGSLCGRTQRTAGCASANMSTKPPFYRIQYNKSNSLYMLHENHIQ